jgi:hypothetical protein
MARWLLMGLALWLGLERESLGATSAAQSGGVLGGLVWMGLFVLICYLIVRVVRRLGSGSAKHLDDPQGDEFVRLGTSISRPVDER